MLRAVGHGMRVCVVQFVKADKTTGELKGLQQLEGVDVKVMGAGFIRDTGESLEKHRQAAAGALEYARTALVSGEYGMIVLDEILYAASKGLVTEANVTNLIEDRPESVHLVLTGRGCPQSVIDRADIVTDMREVKHAFSDGIKSRPGMEY